MKSPNDNTCLAVLCLCPDKPEAKETASHKTSAAPFEDEKNPAQKPWTVFKDVFWI